MISLAFFGLSSTVTPVIGAVDVGADISLALFDFVLWYFFLSWGSLIMIKNIVLPEISQTFIKHLGSKSKLGMQRSLAGSAGSGNDEVMVKLM